MPLFSTLHNHSAVRLWRPGLWTHTYYSPGQAMQPTWSWSSSEEWGSHLLIHGVALRMDWNHGEDVKIVTYNKKYRINKNLFQGMSENQLCSMRKVLPKTTSKLQKYIYMYICVFHVRVCTCMYLCISKTRFSYQLIRQDHVKSTVLTFHCNICFDNCFLDTMFYDLSSYIPLR